MRSLLGHLSVSSVRLSTRILNYQGNQFTVGDTEHIIIQSKKISSGSIQKLRIHVILGHSDTIGGKTSRSFGG